MSWSCNLVGTPEKITERLNKMSTELGGQSKEEFDNALPHLTALLAANVNKKYGPVMVELNANGHATFETKTETVKNEAGEDVEKTTKECTYSTCSVKLNNLGGNLCM